jgi:hypothetical protein
MMAMISDDNCGAARLAVDSVPWHGSSTMTAESSSSSRVRSLMSVATGSDSGSAIADVVDEDRLLFANVAPVLARHSSSDGREPRLARLAGRSVGGGLIMVGNMWDVETETDDISTM